MSTVTAPAASTAPFINRDRMVDWLGIAPFIIFALLFLIVPTLYLVIGAFLTPDGHFTLKNIGDLFTPSILSAYWISIRVSVASALGGAASAKARHSAPNSSSPSSSQTTGKLSASAWVAADRLVFR